MVQRLNLLPGFAVQNIEQRSLPLVKISRHLTRLPGAHYRSDGGSQNRDPNEQN